MGDNYVDLAATPNRVFDSNSPGIDEDGTLNTISLNNGSDGNYYSLTTYGVDAEIFQNTYGNLTYNLSSDSDITIYDVWPVSSGSELNYNIGDTSSVVVKAGATTLDPNTTQNVNFTGDGSGSFFFEEYTQGTSTTINVTGFDDGDVLGANRYSTLTDTSSYSGADPATGTGTGTFTFTDGFDTITYNVDNLTQDDYDALAAQSGGTSLTMPVCFVKGTLIETVDGPVVVEDLRIGSRVLTRDNGIKEIRWIGKRKLSATTLADNPELRPIRIHADALGINTPKSDLLVSPQHRILLRSHIAQRMFGAMEVLAAAKQLQQLEGVDIANDVLEVEYYHFLLDQHEIVFANGAETESLYTGVQALKSVGHAAREEIFAIFPELRDDGYSPEPARPLVGGRQSRKLVTRHMQNAKPVVTG